MALGKGSLPRSSNSSTQIQKLKTPSLWALLATGEGNQALPVQGRWERIDSVSEGGGDKALVGTRSTPERRPKASIHRRRTAVLREKGSFQSRSDGSPWSKGCSGLQLGAAVRDTGSPLEPTATTLRAVPVWLREGPSIVLTWEARDR